MGCLEFMYVFMEGFMLDVFVLMVFICDKILVFRGGLLFEGDLDFGKREGESVDWGDLEVVVEFLYFCFIC